MECTEVTESEKHEELEQQDPEEDHEEQHEENKDQSTTVKELESKSSRPWQGHFELPSQVNEYVPSSRFANLWIAKA